MEAFKNVEKSIDQTVKCAQAANSNLQDIAETAKKLHKTRWTLPLIL